MIAMKKLFYLLIACSLISIAGCLVRSSSVSSSSTTTSAEAAHPEHVIAAADVKIAIGDEKTLAEMIAAHKGQPVFVDYWATWCGPCVAFFPHTVEMSEKYQAQGLKVISVTFDPKEKEADVRAFLAGKGATFENLISSHDPGAAAFEAFDVTQVPYFRLYDKEGTLVKTWDEVPKDADAEIEKLLKPSAE
jgi:thiol-disulfide isomerase/thioredoxin